jgi:predicted dehydrogenase
MKTRGVLIGAGYFAQFQAEAWKRIPGVDLVAVADLIPGKARAFADQFGIRQSYESVTEMLDREKPEFVDIATRPESHLELANLAAERHIAVICQKPMAPTWAECLAMLEVCERARVRLLIHENWRWQPWYREAKRLLEAGMAGPLLQLSFFWRTGDGRGPEPYVVQPYFRQMPRLLVYETLVHILDTFRFLGGEIASVYCQNRRVNPMIIGEDKSLIQVAFASGAFGLIDGDRISGPVPAPVAMGHMKIEGARALLRISGEGRLWKSEYGQPETPVPFEPPSIGYKGDSVYATQLHLLQCLQTGQRSESDGRDYLRTVALVEACYRSAETRSMVALESCFVGNERNEPSGWNRT